MVKLTNDTCYLETPSKIYSEVVNISELKVYAENNCIVGFNKVTGEVKVSTAEDVFNFVNSKLKLAGLNKVVLVDDYNCSEISQLSYDETNNILEVTIDDKWSGFDLSCLYDTAIINWGDVSGYVLGYMNDRNITPNVIITIDMCSYKYIEGRDYDSSLLAYADEDELFGDENSYIIMVNIVNKSMFKETLHIKDLFILDFLNVGDNAIDLTDLEFNPQVNITKLFSAYNLPIIELPDTLYRRLDEHNSKAFEILSDSLTFSDVRALAVYGLKDYKIAESILYGTRAIKTIEELRYSELVKLYEEIPELGKSITTTSMIKLLVNTFIFDMPMDYNDKITPLRQGLFEIFVNKEIIIEDSFDLSLDYESILTTVNMINSVVEDVEDVVLVTVFTLKATIDAITRYGDSKAMKNPNPTPTPELEQFRKKSS